VHIELDTLEILLIVAWWFLSKWVSRLVFVALIGKVIAGIIKKAGEGFESRFQKFTGKNNGGSREQASTDEIEKENI
jgi:hypothetical protein